MKRQKLEKLLFQLKAMDTEGHTFISLLLFGLYPIFGKFILISVIAAILCDVDTVYLVYQKKAYTLKKLNFLLQHNHRIYRQNPKTAYVNVFYLFHTLEFNIILLVLAYWWPVLGFISLGFLFHTIIDIIHHRDLKMPVLRWLFFIEFLRVLRNSKKEKK